MRKHFNQVALVSIIIKNCSSPLLLPLLPISIRLLLKLNDVGLGIREDTWVALPHIAIILVMLVGVNIFSSYLLLPSLYDWEIQQSVLASFYNVEVVAIIGGWALRLLQLWLRLFIKADIFCDGSLDITYRVHDIYIAPIHAFLSLLLPSSGSRHVHHALTLARRHHRGMFPEADHVRMRSLLDQSAL